MSEYLMRVVTSEAQRAEAALEDAKAKFKAALEQPELIAASQMESLAYTQAVVREIMAFWIVSKKYDSSAIRLTKLQAKFRDLKDSLAEDDGVCSTSPWRNAEAATTRKAKIAVMRKFTGLFE